MTSRWDQAELADAGVSVLDCEHKTPPDAGYGHPYVAIPNLVDGRLDLTSVRRITDEHLREWTRRTRPQAGDVIVTRRGRVGDSAVVPEGLRCAIGQNLVILRSVTSRVDQSFLRYAARGRLWADEVDRLRNVGAVFDSLNVRDIARIRVPVPPLREQRAIASTLGVLDDKIDSNRRLKDHLVALARLTFRHRFGGRIEGPHALGDHVAVVRGRSYKSEQLVDSERALVTLKSVRAGGGYNPSGLKPYAGDSKPAQVVRPGEIVVAHTDLTQEAAVVGKPAIVPDNGGFAELVASLDLAIVRPTSKSVSVPFLYFLFLEPAFQQHAYGYANGSTVLHLSKDAIPSFSIELPEAAELAAYDATVQPMLDSAITLVAEQRALALLRDALLPKLISGEIRVSDTADSDEVIGPLAERPAGAKG
jgi:type I restriction enzyme, S subunit